jgi:protein-S-isoprenylcysteine O-methyltransferase Ste14
LGLFLLVLAARIAYLRVSKHINAIAIGRGKKGFQLVFELYAFAGLAVWIVEMLSYALHANFHIFPQPLDAQLINHNAVRAGGVLLVTLGFVILIWAFISFGDSWRIGLDLKTPGRLVTTGIFGRSRNPIYLFLNLWFWGIFLINGTLIFLLFAVLASLHLHYQILREEKFLDGLYGQAYKDYRARTARYFGLG